MDYFVNVKVAPAVVWMDAEAWQERCSIRGKCSGIQNVNRVGQTARPGEVGQNVESSVEPVLIVRLQSVVVAIARKAGVGRAGKIGIGRECERVLAQWKDLPPRSR